MQAEWILRCLSFRPPNLAGNPAMTFRLQHWGSLCVVTLALLADHALAEYPAPALLPAVSGDCPRVYFFRQSEGIASNRRISYERWETCYSRLMGIEGKTLDEEVPGRGVNVESFTRFKRSHPTQLVLLHYNGNGRDPRFQTEKYFAGHWIYYNGAKILKDVPAEEGESEIAVERLELFLMNTGRYQDRNEDIGLCLLDAQGRPDWLHTEQVQLLGVNTKQNTIRVRRACYGTRPMALPAHRSYAAAHVSEGPWGEKSNLLWYYNYSTRCPRDRQGRTCGEVHADELAARFLPGGELAAYDGLEFDVLQHQHGQGKGSRVRGMDTDGDGLADDAMLEGVNLYGVGVVEFCRRLRENLGPNRLIMADGMSEHSQRAFHILNGIESEGWPHLADWEVRDWSGGLNRHFYWRENAAKPVFNYVNHKFTTRGDKPGQTKQPEVPWNIHRLVFAASLFTDSAICYAYAPPKADRELIGIWDEFRQGTANRLGWLGLPSGEAVRLAQQQPDVLARHAAPTGQGFLQRLRAAGGRCEADGPLLKISAIDPRAESTRVRFNSVPCNGPDLFVTLQARAATIRGYPREVPRLLWVGIAPATGNLVGSDASETGMCIRGKPETDLDSDSGASVRWSAKCVIDGEDKPGYLVHPPYKNGVGYAFWQRDVQVPADGRLAFFTGMGDKSPQRSDGVWFRVQVITTDGKAKPVFEHTQKAHEWMRHEVSLAAWSGQRVTLKFISDCGPKDNATTDHSYWGDVQVLAADDNGPSTAPVRYMSFAGSEPFTSGFYFSQVKSKTVDLEIEVEGSEPVWIFELGAYHHPDAMYRQYEHGLVLANPAPRPYSFDLGQLLPGQRFRRLQATPGQDTKTNDGSLVGTVITLGPKEGLFLVREE